VDLKETVTSETSNGRIIIIFKLDLWIHLLHRTGMFY